MGDEDDGLSGSLGDLQKEFLHGHPGLGIEGAEGFVHQQNAGIGGESGGDGHALLHAATQLVDIGILEVGEAYLAG